MAGQGFRELGTQVSSRRAFIQAQYGQSENMSILILEVVLIDIFNHRAHLGSVSIRE